MSGHVLTDAEAEGYIAAGTTARDLVRLRWPDMTAEEADWVLWERTPFPLARGVHDIADAVAAIDETTCGDLTLTGVCRRKVRRFGEACWQHRPLEAPREPQKAGQRVTDLVEFIVDRYPAEVQALLAARSDGTRETE